MKEVEKIAILNDVFRVDLLFLGNLGVLMGLHQIVPPTVDFPMEPTHRPSILEMSSTGWDLMIKK